MSEQRKIGQGFAKMSPERQREIARKGGIEAHRKGTAHEWTTEEARKAGSKGGAISRGGRGRKQERPSVPPPASVIPDRAPETEQPRSADLEQQ